MNKMTEGIKAFVLGILMGLTLIVPGISGGTMAITLGIYDRLIGIMSDPIKGIKTDWKFLLLMVVGAGASILIFSKLIKYLIEYHEIITTFFFIGVVIGTIPMIWKKASRPSIKPMSIIPFLLCLGFMITLFFIGSDVQPEAITAITPISAIKLMIYGAIAAGTMIIPGISGTLVLMILGAYTTFISAAADRNLAMLLFIGIGVLVGILVFAKIIKKLLAKYEQYTYAGILGFVLGSLLTMFPQSFSLSQDGFWPFVVLLIGMAITFISGMDFKKKNA